MATTNGADQGVPNEDQGPVILGAALTVTIAALITTITRLYVRIHLIRNIGWDDYVMISAMVLVSHPNMFTQCFLAIRHVLCLHLCVYALCIPSQHGNMQHQCCTQYQQAFCPLAHCVYTLQLLQKTNTTNDQIQDDHD